MNVSPKKYSWDFLKTFGIEDVFPFHGWRIIETLL